LTVDTVKKTYLALKTTGNNSSWTLYVRQNLCDLKIYREADLVQKRLRLEKPLWKVQTSQLKLGA